MISITPVAEGDERCLVCTDCDAQLCVIHQGGRFYICSHCVEEMADALEHPGLTGAGETDQGTWH